MVYSDKSDKAVITSDADDENEKDMVATPLPKPAMECHQFNSEMSMSASSALFDVLFKPEYGDSRPCGRSVSSPPQLEEPFIDRSNSTGSVTSFDSLGSQSTFDCSPPASLLPDIMEESEGFDDGNNGEQMTGDLSSLSFLGGPDKRTCSFSGTSLDSTGSSALDGSIENTKDVHSPLLSLQLSGERSGGIPDILIVTPSGKTVTEPFVPVSSQTSGSPASEEADEKCDVEDQQIMQPRVNRAYSVPEVQLRATNPHQISPNQIARRGVISLYSPRKFEMRTEKSPLHRAQRWGMDKTEGNKPTLFKIVIVSQDCGINAIAGAYADIRWV